MAVHILGIRHHGPGSAKNVKQYLEKIKPDIILVEGPPEADDMLQWTTHAEMKPPVAILAYDPDNLNRSLFYPFAEFSPEWQAIVYAQKNKTQLRFMDLPVAHKLAMEEERKKLSPEQLNNVSAEPGSEDPVILQEDPFEFLARAAGYNDGEKWWEDHFETRLDNTDIFDAVLEAVTSLREHFGGNENRVEQCREAWMRKTIRQAEKEMFNDIVVICGAWHAPALQNMPAQKHDTELLKNLPKVKVECTWVPWAYSRLSFNSGYGAGINSPGWYHHIWKTKKDIEVNWMTRVARTFRKKQMEISPAHIIESVRLADALAAMRGLSRPGLTELNEATVSIMCMGETIMTELVKKELIISPRLGAVPADSPKPPLHVDIEKTLKRLRLAFTTEQKEITIDLREPRELEKSVFLHRLLLLEIKWGRKRNASSRGTFKENWLLQWDPSFAIEIIDKGVWGNTLEEAAANYVISVASNENSLKTIAAALADTLPSELPVATQALLNRINILAASTGDVMQLMETLPSLVNALRYGNVRKTDTDVLEKIVNAIVDRICISLPLACTSIDEDAANELLELFFKLNDSIALLQHEEQLDAWKKTLTGISSSDSASPVISGYATRLLYDYKVLTGEKLVARFSAALSPGNGYAIAAAWLEGFLKGSGTVLLIDEELWSLVNNWVNVLEEEAFNHVLPLLRRTFSAYSSPERRKLGEKAKGGHTTTVIVSQKSTTANHERALKGLPVVMDLFGLNNENTAEENK